LLGKASRALGALQLCVISRWIGVQVLPDALTPAVAMRSVVAMLASERAVWHLQGRIRRDIAYWLIACEGPAGVSRHEGAAGARGREIVIVHGGWPVI
jgi:hypothetical protein